MAAVSDTDRLSIPVLVMVIALAAVTGPADVAALPILTAPLIERE